MLIDNPATTAPAIQRVLVLKLNPGQQSSLTIRARHSPHIDGVRDPIQGVADDPVARLYPGCLQRFDQ
jgi:hypothetical protein